MIQILKVTVRNESGKDRLAEYHPEHSVFATIGLFELYRKSLIDKWSRVFDMKVKIDILRKEETSKSITPTDILHAYCNLYGHNASELLGRTRARAVVDARVEVNQICHEEGFRLTDIEEHLWKHRLYYHYKKRHYEMIDTEKGYLDQFERKLKEVTEKLFT